MTLATFQAQGKYVYIFLYLTRFFQLLFTNARWADAEKGKKEQNSRCGGWETRTQSPPVCKRANKERGEKNPLVQWLHAYTLSHRDVNAIEATFSYKNKPAIFLF